MFTAVSYTHLSDLITQQDDIKVIERKDYIKKPKSNGYRSYHMIVEIPVFFAKGKIPMRVESVSYTHLESETFSYAVDVKGHFYFGNVYEVPAYNVEIPQLQLQ